MPSDTPVDSGVEHVLAVHVYIEACTGLVQGSSPLYTVTWQYGPCSTGDGNMAL